MAKKKEFKPIEEKRAEKGIETMQIEFVKDFKSIKKGSKHTFGLDTAADFVLKGYAKATDSKGKEVMAAIEEEDEKHKEEAAERKEASK